MATVLQYNGFTNLQSVHIDRYESEPVYADDGISQESTKHTIEGTALITGTDDEEFEERLSDARNRLVRPRAPVDNSPGLQLEIDGREIVNEDAPDDFDGPFGEFRVSEIAGNRSAIVTFKVTWFKYELVDGEGENLNPNGVLSHRWTQQFEIDARGIATHTVVGIIRVRAGALDTGSDETDTGRNPDAFRLSVVPQLPTGFRRESMTFATDESGNRLLYTVVNKQYARDIPFPALSGNGFFEYTRDIGQLGTKTFSIELEAHQKVLGADLLAAAVEVSKTRIRYTGAAPDLILRITIAEADFLTDNKIRFEVIARCTNSGSDIDVQPPNLRTIGTRLIRSGSNEGAEGEGQGLRGYDDQSPYGSALLRAVRREFMTPISVQETDPGSIPRAETETHPNESTVETIVLHDADFQRVEEKIGNRQANTNPDHTANTYLKVQIFDHVEINTNIVNLQSQAFNGEDAPFQIKRPDVYLVSEMTITRGVAMPPRQVHGVPSGAITKHLSIRTVSSGHDAAGNPQYTVKYERRAQILRNANSDGWVVENHGGPAFLSWWLPFGVLHEPVDPRTNVTPDPTEYNPLRSNTVAFIAPREDYYRA